VPSYLTCCPCTLVTTTTSCTPSEEKAKSELEVKMNALATEAKGFKRERQRLEEQLVHAQVGGQMLSRLFFVVV
jgi:hypothetical protein